MRVAICDDDTLFLETFSRRLQKIEEISDVETYSNLEVFHSEKRQSYDLVFMEIDWENEKTGIDAAAHMTAEHLETKVIFVTAFIDRFVEEIFLQKTNVCGILNKPVNQEKLEIYVAKVALELKNEKDRVLQVKEKKRTLVIPLSEIKYLESSNHAVKIYTQKAIHVIYEPMKTIEQGLSEEFGRCHRGFVVNMDYIKGFSKNDLILKDNTVISIGKRHKVSFEKKYQEYLIRKM